MPGTALRRTLFSLMWVGIGLAILAGVLLYTPLGARLGVWTTWRLLSDRSGVSLSVESVHGGLLRGLSLEGLSVTSPEGERIFEADTLAADLGSLDLRGHSVSVAGVRLEGISLLLQTDQEGRLLGWSDLFQGSPEAPPDTTPTTAGAGGWTVSVGATLADVNVSIVNAAAGFDLELSRVAGSLAGRPDDFRIALAGSLSYSGSGLSEPIAGAFDLDGALEDGAFTLSPFDVSTNAGNVTLLGTLEADGSAFDVQVQSTAELNRTGAVFGLSGLGGSVEITGNAGGSFSEPAYAALVTARNVSYGDVDAESVRAALAGDLQKLRVGTLAVDAFGGNIAGTVSIGFPSVAGAAPDVTANLVLRDLEIESLGSLASVRADTSSVPGSGASRARGTDGSAGPPTDLSGVLGGALFMSWSAPGVAGLDASAMLNVRDLRVDERRFGDIELSAQANRGIIVASGSCCDAVFDARASASGKGISDFALSLDVADLGTLGRVLDVRGLSGNARAEISAASLSEPLVMDFTVASDDAVVKGLTLSPLRLDGVARGNSYEASFSLFGTSVVGSGWLDASGGYEASVRMDSLRLSSVLTDSMRASLGLSGTLDGEAIVTGRLDDAYRATGELSALHLSARGQSVTLAKPFTFMASPDSIRATDFFLEGSFGSFSGSLTYAAPGSLDAAVAMERLNLSEALSLLPNPPRPLPAGIVSGRLLVSGTRRSPTFTADLEGEDISFEGMALDTLAVSADGDSMAITFDLSARSSVSGTIWSGGTIPVRPNPKTLLTFDPAREFGATIFCRDFVLDASDAILPMVHGDKKVELDGSVLLTGLADSLATVNGSGRFDRMRLAFELAEFTLADTMRFQVDRGDVKFDTFTFDVLRQRALGSPEAGTITFMGHVNPRANVDVTASVANVNVGVLARALTGGAGFPLRGSLTADASVTGKTSSPDVEFSWKMRSPRVLDFGFTAADGSGTYRNGRLDIGRTKLAAGEGSIDVSGSVYPSAEPGAGGERRPPSYDLRVTTTDFRLDRVRPLPVYMENLSGRLEIDLRLQGRGDSMDASGEVTLSRGVVGGFGLADPIKNVAASIEAKGTSIVLKEARADMGSGSIEMSGLVDFSTVGTQPTFYARARLRSPEIIIKDTFEDNIDGSITWGGTPSNSTIQGKVTIRDGAVTKSVGLSDFVSRRPAVTVIQSGNDPRANVHLDVDVAIDNVLKVDSNVAQLDLSGGGLVRGTLLEPRFSGGVQAAADGTFRYLGNKFSIETLSISFENPNHRDPYIVLTGTTTADDASGQAYDVTLAMEGYLLSAVPTLTSTPPLSEPDIASLLTFGTTFGGLVSGQRSTGTSGDTFDTLARQAFFSSAFGLAANALEKLLNLDTVTIEEEGMLSGETAETGVTIGKEFGGRLQVNYSTPIGRFSGQRVELSLKLTRQFWLETRSDPEGNHAVDVKLQIPFK